MPKQQNEDLPIKMARVVKVVRVVRLARAVRHIRVVRVLRVARLLRVVRVPIEQQYWLNGVAKLGDSKDSTGVSVYPGAPPYRDIQQAIVRLVRNCHDWGWFDFRLFSSLFSYVFMLKISSNDTKKIYIYIPGLRAFRPCEQLEMRHGAKHC